MATFAHRRYDCWCGDEHLPTSVHIRIEPLWRDPMANAVFDCTADSAPLLASFGTERDDHGNPVSGDPVVSASWSVDNADVLTGAVSDDTLSALFTLTGADGVANITAQAITQSGVTIVATQTVNVGSGSVATVDIDLVAQPVVAAPATGDTSSDSSAPPAATDTTSAPTDTTAPDTSATPTS